MKFSINKILDMNHLRKGLLTLALILVTAITFAQVSITVNVPTAGGFSAALTAAGGDANTVTNLTVTGNINATDIQFMNANMPVLEVLDLETAQLNQLPNYAFYNNKSIKSIKLPTSLNVIGDYAFWLCEKLEGTITFPNSLTSIGNSAFINCKGLTGSLTIPNSVIFIGREAFLGCNGLNGLLTLPNQITLINEGTFSGCSGLTGNLTIPNSVKTIKNNAFNSCKGLNGVLVFPNSLTSIEYYAFYRCTGFTGNLVIPNTVNYLGAGAFMYCTGFNGNLTLSTEITSIVRETFTGCSGFIGNLTIPNSIKSIGAFAFYGCKNLSGSLVIPNSVGTIEGSAFEGCTGFNGSLTISNSTISIGECAFDNCTGFTGGLTIPNSVKFLGLRAFNNCSGFNGSLTIPNSVTSIEAEVFFNCSNLTGNLIIPNSVTSIGDAAFFNCSKLTGNLTISSNLTSIGGSVFTDCSGLNGSLIIPNSVTSIGYGAFTNCSGFTGNITIPSSVISIGQNAFVGCNGFTGTLTIPSSVTSIGNQAFFGCFRLQKISVAITSPLPIDELMFEGINKTTCELNVPNGSKTAYQAANYWKDFTNITESIFVFFNSQGGSAIPDLKTTYNTTILEPTAPTRTGYTFGGWYKEAACTNAWAFATDVVTANTALYAKWNINTYTITFNSQGGSAVESVNANYNTTIASPTAPDLEGYTFGGWYKEAACTNAWIFTTDVVTANTTLYAKWINVYTVTFNSQGGTIVTSVNANDNTTITAPIAPERTGYTFGGWYKEAACTNAWDFATDRVTANTTLYAKWTINTYTVTFNSNGGTSVASVNAVYNTKISEPTPPTKTGYTFDGWYINLSDDFSFNFNLYNITSNLTLQAKWIPITYYVTFYSEGIGVNSRGAEYNTPVERPDDPVRTGHVFNGWYKEPTFITPWNFSSDRVTSNMSLYAKWTAITYTVTFDSQGGTPVTSTVVNHGAKVTEPTPPLRNGYNLKGWYDQPTDGFIWFFDYSTVTKDMTLYAHWNINSYTITFDSKGGSAVASKTAEFNSTITAPSTPTRTGYTFAGWYKDEAFTSIWDFNSDVVTTNATLYAKWTINTYTVTFNTQGGNSISSVSANFNSTITTPSTPTRTGYTFNGWYKEASCTNQWAFATDVVTSNITLYAKWTINAYTVTFNTQGGSAISSVSATFNSTITVPSAPIKTGYTFDGWYKEAGCINPWVFASDLVTTDITLYAKWNLSSDIETISGNNLKLYPNPAVNNLTIEGENIEEITVYSLIGTIVMQPITTAKEGKCTFSIDVLESGIYFARIKISGNKIATIKFIKQ
ncbi:MAG: T9SS C-terminal target domain-containing protein [Bacteroidales bacterium]|nr:MAG: T9SS C-terminal target domain-containing protein [Bacteroidales bacterium]